MLSTPDLEWGAKGTAKYFWFDPSVICDARCWQDQCMDALQGGTAPWQQASTRVADRATDHTIRFETWVAQRKKKSEYPSRPAASEMLQPYRVVDVKCLNRDDHDRLGAAVLTCA